MAWMMDTYSMNPGHTVHRRGHRQADLARRQPRARHEATGRGVFVAGREAAAKQLGVPIDGARVAVQGFGNVGAVAAPRLSPRPAPRCRDAGRDGHDPQRRAASTCTS